jgi:glutaredoxin
MKAHEAFPSKYIKTEDLEGREITATIERVEIEVIKNDEGESNKPVVYFKNKSRGMVLNLTNFNSIADLCGQDSDEWSGKKISLYPTKTQLGSKTVPCIRIKPANGPAANQLRAPVKQSENPAAFVADSIDDDIPF